MNGRAAEELAQGLDDKKANDIQAILQQKDFAFGVRVHAYFGFWNLDSRVL